MAKTNKVKFNVKQSHYATFSTETSPANPYNTPVPINGTVSISLEQQGELTPFYADGIVYYTSSTNGGYEGDLTIALIPDDFRVAVLGEKADTNQVLVENANAVNNPFAYGCRIDGNELPTFFWFYNCTATRPSIEATTIEDTTEVNTDVLTLSIAPDDSGNVRSKFVGTADEGIGKTWFDNVYIPNYGA